MKYPLKRFEAFYKKISGVKNNVKFEILTDGYGKKKSGEKAVGDGRCAVGGKGQKEGR